MIKISLISGITFLLLMCGCSSKEQRSNPIRPVKTTIVTTRNEIKRDYSGLVETAKSSNLAFRVPGQIIEMPISAGQKIKKGDLIAKIDPREINLQLQAAKSAYETAKAQLIRNEKLLKRQAVSQQEMEIVRSNYQNALSNYKAQQNNLKDIYLRAPFSGSVIKTFVDNYQQINAGQTVAQLIDSKDLKIYFTLPDNSLSLIERDDKLFTVEFESYKGIFFQAVLREYIKASPEGGGIPVFLTITDPRFEKDEYDIKPGFACNVVMTVTLDNEQHNYPSIPLTALFASAENNQAYVWVFDPKTSTVQKRSIETGALVGESNILVMKGLQSGEEIVTAGVTQIVDGEKVKVLK